MAEPEETGVPAEGGEAEEGSEDGADDNAAPADPAHEGEGEGEEEGGEEGETKEGDVIIREQSDQNNWAIK